MKKYCASCGTLAMLNMNRCARCGSSNWSVESSLDIRGVSSTHIASIQRSTLGLASFLISSMTLVVFIAVIITAGILEASTPGGISGESSGAMVLEVLLLLCWFSLFVSFGLGVASVVRGEKKRILAITGIFFSIFVGIISIILILIGSFIEYSSRTTGSLLPS